MEMDPAVKVKSVVSFVVTVVSAYEDANALLSRLKEKREASGRPLDSRLAQDLEASLSLGPIVVQGQYDNDFRRFGQSYAQGDQVAREQLKSIIITLYVTLVNGLRAACADDTDLDFPALRTASDNCRIDALMALCQLYQRMSIPTKSQPGPDKFGVTAGGMGSGARGHMDLVHRLSHSSATSSALSPSRSSSGRSPVDFGTTSNTESPTSMTGLPTPSSMNSTPSHKTRGLLSGWRKAGSKRRDSRSSSAGTSNYQSPVSPVGGFDDTSISMVKKLETPAIRIAPSMKLQELSGEILLGKPGYLNSGHHWSHSSIEEESFVENSEFSWSPPEPSHLTSPLSDRPSSAASQNRSLYGSRNKWRNSNRDGSINTHSSRLHRSSGPMSTRSSSTAVPSSVPVNLSLPCRQNDFAGFCKGAWKLQLGMKKPFDACIRPSGMISEVPYWRCYKCHYEGPVWGKAARSSWVYDNSVHTHAATGIRYRWVFLAKSHISMKATPNTKDGSEGSFGCMFCCAERRKGATRVFGGLDGFMEHLLEHRQLSLAGPDMENLLQRINFIMDRVAAKSEKFDLNLPPLLSELA